MVFKTMILKIRDKHMSEKEYYPSVFSILSRLDTECILVGSAAVKPLTLCKDVDFVISGEGLKRLMEYEYYLDKHGDHWMTWIPFHDTGFQKCVDFFHDICDIENENKWSNRLTYAEAINRPLKIIEIEMVEVLALMV